MRAVRYRYPDLLSLRSRWRRVTHWPVGVLHFLHQIVKLSIDLWFAVLLIASDTLLISSILLQQLDDCFLECSIVVHNQSPESTALCLCITLEVLLEIHVASTCSDKTTVVLVLNLPLFRSYQVVTRRYFVERHVHRHLNLNVLFVLLWLHCPWQTRWSFTQVVGSLVCTQLF